MLALLLQDGTTEFQQNLGGFDERFWEKSVVLPFVQGDHPAHWELSCVLKLYPDTSQQNECPREELSPCMQDGTRESLDDAISSQ